MGLKKSIAWTMLGNIISAACQWGYVVVLAKFSTPENVGYYAFAQAIVYPVFAFLNLQLRRLQVTDQNQQIGFSSYFSFSVYSGFLAFLCSIGIGWFAESNILAFLPILAAFSLSKFADTLSDVCYGKFQQQRDMKTVAVSMILRSIAGIASFSTLILLQQTLWQACLITAASWFLIYLVYDARRIRKYSTTPFDKIRSAKQIKLIIRLGLPLGALILLNQIHLNLPRYILKSEIGMAEVGFFAAIASLITVGNIFISSVGQAFLPDMAKSYAEGHKSRFIKLFILLASFAFLVGSVAVAASYWWGQEILLLLYSQEFADKQPVLLWSMLAGLAWYLSGASGVTMTAARKFSSQAWLSVLVVLTTLVAGLWLIPNSGAMGAAQSLLIGALIKFSLQLLQVIIIILIPIRKS